MTNQKEKPAEFGGQCAFALSVGKEGVAGNPRHSTVEDGKRYVFANPVAKLLWQILPGRAKKAQANWSSRS